jgi:hypothetical protein
MGGRTNAPNERAFVLSQNVLRAEFQSRASDSVFPPQEGPSFCSRPTPVTAVPAEVLQTLGVRANASDDSAIVPLSSRRVESMRPSGDGFDHAFFAGATPSLPPSIPPPAPVRPVSRARMAFAWTLFVTLFGGVAALLGLALMQKFAP